MLGWGRGEIIVWQWPKWENWSKRLRTAAIDQLPPRPTPDLTTQARVHGAYRGTWTIKSHGYRVGALMHAAPTGYPCRENPKENQYIGRRCLFIYMRNGSTQYKMIMELSKMDYAPLGQRFKLCFFWSAPETCIRGCSVRKMAAAARSAQKFTERLISGHVCFPCLFLQ